MTAQVSTRYSRGKRAGRLGGISVLQSRSGLLGAGRTLARLERTYGATCLSRGPSLTAHTIGAVTSPRAALGSLVRLAAWRQGHADVMGRAGRSAMLLGERQPAAGGGLVSVEYLSCCLAGLGRRGGVWARREKGFCWRVIVALCRRTDPFRHASRMFQMKDERQDGIPWRGFDSRRAMELGRTAGKYAT